MAPQLSGNLAAGEGVNCRSRVRVALTVVLAVAVLPPVAEGAFPGQNGKIAWDSTRYPFDTGTIEDAEIFSANSDGTGAVQLTFLDTAAREPRWSPDGASIVFSAYVHSNYDVYAVPSGGGRPVRLTHARSMERTPFYSADGKSIYFASNLEGRFEVFRAPLAVMGEATQVTRGGGFAPQESPDGRYLYYSRDARVDISGPTRGGTQGIWRVRTSGERAWAEAELLGALSSPILPGAWAATAEGVYVVSRPRGASLFQTRIQHYDLASRNLSIVYSETASSFGVQGITASRAALAWAQVDRLESDLRVVENFR